MQLTEWKPLKSIIWEDINLLYQETLLEEKYQSENSFKRNIIKQMDLPINLNICAKLGCQRMSNYMGNACFCSDECRDYVLQRVHGCGILLVGHSPINKENYMILGGYNENDDMSNTDFVYETFSGKIEAGEDPYDCAIRELEEESGMQLLNKKELKAFLKISPAILRPAMIKGGIYDIEHSKYFMIIALNMEYMIFDNLQMRIAWFVRFCKIKNNIGNYTHDWIDIKTSGHFKLSLNGQNQALRLSDNAYCNVRDRDIYFINSKTFIDNCNILANNNVMGLSSMDAWNGKFHS
jgi:hypothetical protein